MTYQELFNLSGRVAVVTGSSKGIGRVIAETLAEAGARVVVSSRRMESCKPVADGITAAGGEAVAIPCHMSHLDQVRALVDRTLEQWGQIDVLVCNAAVNPHFGPMVDVTESAYDKVMDTNVKHNLWLCNLVLPQMASREDGSVIIV
ncbi:MAG: SDR family NAD(P)-dependent oxidoreductase, partial [Vicinamibacterales bacterium]|nr:SDR family NAD(P)-dependent oxidoreductase [Vicinamibacterales bacterium]